MGRSFTSVRQGVSEITDRWGRVAEELGEGDRIYARQVVAMAKRHASEEFYLFDSPLEAAAFSALVELLRDSGEV
jgi:hypothetical protein